VLIGQKISTKHLHSKTINFMTKVKYLKGCRSCLWSDKQQGTYLLTMTEKDEKQILSYTEFQVATLLEKYFLLDNKKCPSCNQNNWEFWDIEINDVPLIYNSDNHEGKSIFSAIISKSGKNEYDMESAGDQYFPMGVFPKAHSFVQNYLNSLPKNKLVENKTIGRIEMHISVESIFINKGSKEIREQQQIFSVDSLFDNANNEVKDIITFEKFLHVGFGFEEMYNQINQLFSNFK
jgi:hypothetical protein